MDTYEGSNEDPLSLHKYLYCHGNPVNNRDPNGHDIGEMLSVMDIDTTLAGFALPTMSVGAVLGTGGPDITQTLKTTLLEIQMAFWGWSPPQKSVAIDELFSPPSPWGKTGASGGLLYAWDIVPLKNLGYGFGNGIPNGNGRPLLCGKIPWNDTVAVNGKCFYGGAVNYAQWGTMFKAIHEYYDQIGDPIDASLFTLSQAQLLATKWKTIWHGDSGERVKEAKDFTAYGYNGTMPATCLPCRPSGKVCQNRDFEWVWEPYKPRQGGRQ
jgi:hypothetical protein